MFAVRSQTDRNREREPLHACSAEVGCGHARLGSLTRLRRSSPLSVGNPKQPIGIRIRKEEATVRQ